VIQTNSSSQTLQFSLIEAVPAHAADITAQGKDLSQLVISATDAYQGLADLKKRAEGPISRVKRAMVAAW
jgi:hypothetical protein